jgi:ABC-type oligopeptide transport system substrate-binding subunit
MILRLLLVAVLAIALAVPVHAQTPRKGGTLVVGMSQDLPGLDPHPSTSTITYQVLSLVYQGLVDFDRDLKIRAGAGRVVDHRRRRPTVDVQAARGREVPQRAGAGGE